MFVRASERVRRSSHSEHSAYHIALSFGIGFIFDIDSYVSVRGVYTDMAWISQRNFKGSSVLCSSSCAVPRPNALSMCAGTASRHGGASRPQQPYLALCVSLPFAHPKPVPPPVAYALRTPPRARHRQRVLSRRGALCKGRIARAVRPRDRSALTSHPPSLRPWPTNVIPT